MEHEYGNSWIWILFRAFKKVKIHFRDYIFLSSQLITRHIH